MPVTADGIEHIQLSSLKNKHENFTHNFQKRISYRLYNPDQSLPNYKRYCLTTKNIQKIIKDSAQNGEQIRAVGSIWSFNKNGCAKDRLVDTKGLRFRLTVKDKHLDPACTYRAEDLFFLQCGNSILSINSNLEKSTRLKKKSIIASGASNGQTIVGAMSTNTHGSAFKVGSVHDAVVGIHLITSGDDHFFIQRASDPVVNNTFSSLFETTLISDDDIFNAVVVSFGSMGIIHGVMLRTEDIFHLEKYREKLSYTSALKTAMDTLNFSHISLPQPQDPSQSELYHWALVVNPYQLKNNQQGIYMTTIYKTPYDPSLPKKTLKERGYTYGDDTLAVIGGFTKLLASLQINLIPTLVNQLIGLQYSDNDVFPWKGTIGDTFGYTSIKGKAASMAIGVDVTNSSKTLDLMLSIIDGGVDFPGVVGIRWVKGTDATLGFTKFPITCVIELDGVDIPQTHAFYNLFWQSLEQEPVKFTLHWGKINHYINQTNLSNMYAQSSIDDWIRVRNMLLPTTALKDCFKNKYIETMGLDKVVGPIT